MNNRDYFLAKKFYDDIRFPYGFSRSGEFSISESQAIEFKGAYFNAVGSGMLVDPTEEDIRVSKVLRGELEAINLEEKAWLKYLKMAKRSQVWLCDCKKNEKKAIEINEDDEIDFDGEMEEFESIDSSLIS